METRKEKRKSIGSALILTIVLTSLLAIVGALFIIGSQVDKISSSSVMDSQDLSSAVQTILARLSQEMAEDVPGVAEGQEYYDYPGPEDDWLASLEPYTNPEEGRYKWHQVSDVNGYWRRKGVDNVDILAEHIPEYPVIELDNRGRLEDQPADADGDGVADAKWIEVEDVRSSRGQPVYAAIRVIDNGGMLNVNTGWKFDPEHEQTESRIDGSRQIQINLADLSQRSDDDDKPSLQEAADKLHEIRKGDATADIDKYETEVIWGYEDPNRAYAPFNISEELSLRNRYFLKIEEYDTRLEDTNSNGTDFWKEAYDGSKIGTRHKPLGSYKDPESDPDAWFWKVNYHESSPDEMKYDYRHISTIHNMDRIIDTQGNRMINLKDAVSMRLWNVNGWYAGTFATEVLSNPEGVYTEDQLAQILVNIKDFADDDSLVSMIQYGSGSERRYGFEDPVIYITEVLLAIQDITQWASGEGPGLDPPTLYNPSLAIEFFRPFPNEGVIHSEEWRVRIASAEFDLVPGAFQERGGRYYVMLFESSNPDYQFLRDFVEYSDAPIDGAVNVDPRVVLSWPVGGDEAQYDVYFGTNKDNVTDATFTDQQGVYADRIDSSDLPPREYDPPGELPSGTSHYWRVDYLDSSGEVLQSGQVMEFTTWTSEPEDYKGDISTIGDADVLRNIDEIVLKRRVPGAPGDGYVVVDRVDKNFTSASFEFEGVPGSAGVPETLQSYQRYNTYSSTVSDPANTGTSVNHLEIKRIWVQNPKVSTLGYRNERGIPDPGSNINSLVQARPLPFRNVGEIGNVFVKSAYPADDVPEIIDGVPQIIDRDDTEVECRVMLTDPDVQKLFNYFTMIAPADVNENR
ncbi:MAG: hypothetical protein ACYTEE_09535, partial [Planctomycetota bacterium]